MMMTQFASILANQLINNVDRLLSFYSPLSQEVSSLINAPSNIAVSNASQESTSSTSTLTADQLPISLREMEDVNGTEHHQTA
jgi:hypothetical protein